MPKKITAKKTAKVTTPKVPVTKPAAKKVALKTASSKTPRATAKGEKKGKFLVCAPDDKCFWTTDGKILQDLSQLKLAFGTMDDEVFLHHVNQHKNDFAEWVEHVLADAACAADLRKAKNLPKAEAVVTKHLRLYKL